LQRFFDDIHDHEVEVSHPQPIESGDQHTVDGNPQIARETAGVVVRFHIKVCVIVDKVPLFLEVVPTPPFDTQNLAVNTHETSVGAAVQRVSAVACPVHEVDPPHIVAN
jgi:hypothetical protein